MSKILIPVRYSAWLAGQLGQNLHDTLSRELKALPDLKVTRLPRGFLIEANEAEGVAVEAAARAIRKLDDDTRERYPVFHHEMGPVWTGTLQVVFPAVPA